jgi:hypothetical protein
MEFFIVVGIVAIPLFLLGLFAAYKGHKAERAGRRSVESLQI